MSQRGFHVVGPAVVVQAAYDRREKLLGNPKPPVHIGGGRHVEAPETWDGTGATPPGWTKEHAPILQHPTNPALRATSMDDVVAAARTGPRSGRLNASEHAAMQADLAGAGALGAEWDGAQPAVLVARER